MNFLLFGASIVFRRLPNSVFNLDHGAVRHSATLARSWARSRVPFGNTRVANRCVGALRAVAQESCKYRPTSVFSNRFEMSRSIPVHEDTAMPREVTGTLVSRVQSF